MYILYLEVTLPGVADPAAMDALRHLGRIFDTVEGVISTRLLRNTEDQRVILLEVASKGNLLETVRKADLTLDNVKTRVWAFEVLSEPSSKPSA